MITDTLACYLIGDNQFNKNKCREILEAHNYKIKNITFRQLYHRIKKNVYGVIVLCYKNEQKALERMGVIREITNVPHVFIVGSTSEIELLTEKQEILFSIFDPLSGFIGDLAGVIGFYLQKVNQLEGKLRPLL